MVEYGVIYLSETLEGVLVVLYKLITSRMILLDG